MNFADTCAIRWAEMRMVPPAERSTALLTTIASNAFFDESGTHDGSPIIAMGGVVSNYDAWVEFEIEWKRILKARGIDGAFRFSEFMARKGRFHNDWSNDERNALMERLCTTLSECIVVGLGVAVFRSEYDSIIPFDLQGELKHPYYWGLYTCLYQLISWPHFGTRITLPRRITFLFDRKKNYEGFASRIYYSIRDNTLPQVAPSHPSVFGDMGFGDKEQDAPLQAADLLVGVVARNYLKARKQNAPLEEIMEKSLRTLGKSGRLLVANAGLPELKAFVNIFRPGKYPDAPRPYSGA